MANNQRRLWLILFNMTFFIGYMCRLVDFGWLMIVLALPEYVLRSFYYLTGLYILEKNSDKNNYAQVMSLQCLYMLTSFFSSDGSDANSYTFAHLWLNPPTFIPTLWTVTAVITLVTLLVIFIKNLKQRSAFHVKPGWFLKNTVLGCMLIPVLSVSLLLLLSRVA